MQRHTRAERFEIKRQELARLKAELKRARSAYRQAVLRDEIRAIARELAQLQER